MVKHKHFKFMGFLNISGEAEIHIIPKTWGKWISIVREKYGKTQTLQSYVSQIFWVRQKSIPFPKYGQSGFPQYEKSMGKHKNFKFIGFLNISG